MNSARVLFAVSALIFSARSTAEDFANCIINKMQGIQNDSAAYAVLQLCKERNADGLDGVKQGAGRGLFSFDSGNECTVKKAGNVRSVQAANFIGLACRKLYDPPVLFDLAPGKETKSKTPDIKSCWKVVSKDAGAYPMRIDGETTITGTACKEDGGRVVYVYQNLTEIQKDRFSTNLIETAKNISTNSICSDPNLLKLLKLFDMGYDFYSKTGTYLGGYVVHIEDCDKRSSRQQSDEVAKVVSRSLIAYPFLDHQSANANQKAIDAVVERREFYLGKGYSIPDALTKAVNEIGPMYAARNGDTPSPKKPSRQEKSPPTLVEMQEIRTRGCNPSGVMTDEEIARCRGN